MTEENSLPPAPADNDERMDNTAGEIVEGGEMQTTSPDPIITNDGDGSVHVDLTGEEADPTASTDGAAVSANTESASTSSDSGETTLPSDSNDDPTQLRFISPVKPTICRNVEYRSRTGNYSVPAMINCTVDSIYQPGVEHGFVPPLSGKDNVHLTVFSPGRPGMRIDTAKDTPQEWAENFVVKTSAVMLIDGERVPVPVSENVSGCYQEWDIPFDMGRGPGTWCWPERV